MSVCMSTFGYGVKIFIYNVCVKGLWLLHALLQLLLHHVELGLEQVYYITLLLMVKEGLRHVALLCIAPFFAHVV